MQVDRDGIISLLLGVLLAGVAITWKYIETGDLVASLVGILVEIIRGGLVMIGLLFVLVGLLFIFG